MSTRVWWAVFGIPLFTMISAWIGISFSWKEEVNRILMALAMVFPTAAALLGCGALAYVQLGGKVRPGDTLEVYGFGLMFALVGSILGFPIGLKFQRWFSLLGLGVSAWMLFWFGLMMSAAD